MRVTLLLLACAAVSGCRSDSSPEDPGPTELGAAAEEAERIPIGDVLWYTDYDTAARVAREARKPLWVHFGEDPG